MHSRTYTANSFKLLSLSYIISIFREMTERLCPASRYREKWDIQLLNKVPCSMDYQLMHCYYLIKFILLQTIELWSLYFRPRTILYFNATKTQCIISKNKLPASNSNVTVSRNDSISSATSSSILAVTVSSEISLSDHINTIS